MGSISLGTHKVVKDLLESGIPEPQTEIFVRVQQEILVSTLLTKRDLDRVEIMLDKLSAKFENEVALLTWMIGALIAFAITNFGKQFF
jgi:hypothetical protein